MCDSFLPHGLQCSRLPRSSLSPGVCSNSCPLNWWCHPTISSSVTSFFCPQFFPGSGSFPIGWLFTSGDQSIGASALASVLPMNIQGWFPLELTGLVTMYAMLCLRWITNEDHLHSTEKSAQCYTATLKWRGVGYMYMYSWVALLFTWNCHKRLYSSIK